MSNWTFRTHKTKDGRKILYARSRKPIRQEDGTIAYRQVERSCGTGSIQAAREKTREFDREYHDAVNRPAARSQSLTFMEAAEQYLLSGNSGRYLEPILKEIGLMPIDQIDQAVMLELAQTLQPDCAASTVNRHIFTPVSAVLNFVGLRPDFKRPKGHDRLPTIDRTELPPDGWFEAVITHLAPSKRALMLLLTIHGLRISEAIERVSGDLDPVRWTLSVPDSKTGVPFLIHLADPVIEAFKAYDWRKMKWLFGTAQRSNISRDFRKACEKAGVKNYGTHHLGRHTFASRILEDGKSLVFLQNAGRWKSLKAVARYAHLAKSEVADEVKEIGKRWHEERRKGEIIPMKKKTPEADG